MNARQARPYVAAWLLCACVLAPVFARAEPNPETWRWHFQRARAALIEQRFVEAQTALERLAADAPTPEEARVASELASVARASAARAPMKTELRSSDELGVLYTTAVFYGLGTSGWLALQLRPESFGAALLPFAVITPATVGAIAIGDAYRPLRHGVPHAIAAGLYLGFGEGLWLVAYQHELAERRDGTRPWRSERVSTVLWAGSTIGAVAGGLIGGWRRPTPGRVSFTASASIWGGVLSALTTSAISPRDDRRAEYAYLIGGIGYNLGLLSGILLGPDIAPSVARVRLIDLSCLGGVLLAGGTALLTDELGSRGVLGTAAFGGAAGLVVGWIATTGMPSDRSHDRLRSGIEPVQRELPLRAGLVPMQDGLMATLHGEL